MTVWDATALTAVARLRLAEAGRVAAAGLSGDGRTVVTFRFGADPSAKLWDVASGRSFARPRSPSPAVAEIFAEGGTGLNKTRAARDAHFLEVVRSLPPTAGAIGTP